ncbi:MAG: AraC family transcriptional regulator [Bacteroidota bacterium]
MNRAFAVPVTHLDNRLDPASLPDAPDRIVFSSLSGFNHAVERSGLSVKYVYQGTERYRFDGIPHDVTAGHFLVVNEGRSYEVEIPKGSPAVGLCLYFSQTRVGDVYRALSQDDTALLDLPADDDADAPAFYEHLLADHETPLGRRIRRLAAQLYHQDALPIDFDEIHAGLIAALLRTQGQVRRAMDRLPAARASTRAELYRRVRLARDVIEARFAEPLAVADIAREAALSEYHLIRSFKRVFGTTPYRYLLDRRLEAAALLLRTSEHSVTEVAYEVGFGDLAAFSKAFKKHHGVAPSRLAA